MIHRLQRWLTPPSFPDSDLRTRRASLLNYILLAFILLVLFIFVGALVGGRTPPPVLITTLLTLTVGLILRAWLRRGGLTGAGLGLLVMGLGIVTADIMLLGTARAPVTSVLLLLVMTAGLLFDLGGMIIMTVICSLVVAGLIGAENAGWLPRPDLSMTITQWATFTAIFAWAGTLMYAALRLMNRALARAECDLRERQHAETALRQAQVELERRVEERTIELKATGERLQQELAERQQAEAALRQSEEQYRSLFDNMTEGFALHELVLDATGAPCDYRFLRVNPAFEQLTGLTRADLDGQRQSQVMPNEDPYWFETYRSVALTGEPIRLEHYSTALQRHYEVFAYRPASNQFAVTFSDITERKQAEARILRLNRLYATLGQINEAIVHARDRDTLFREICRVAIEFGQFRLAWIGLVDEAEQRVRPVAFAGEEQGYLTDVSIRYRDETLGRGPTGTAIREGRCIICQDIGTNPLMTPWREPALQRGYRSSAAVPIRHNSDIIGALTVYAADPDGFDADDERLLDEIGLDISFALDMLEQEARRRHAEGALQALNLELEERVVRRTAELATANERLTELDRLKSKFVSTVSHELRTPVTSLGLLVDLLERGKPEKREHYVVRLREQMTRLQTLINDILDLSRLERDASEADWATVDINPMVEHVVAMQHVAAEAAGLELSSEISAQPVWVRARPEHLLRAITNLISNAIKYTRTGTVDVITYTESERLCVQIKDTGLGIAPEDLSHLFERFYRGKQAAQSNIPGTGLGLSIVKEIVEAHGGTVYVASELGVGSMFRLWLPVVTVESST